MDSIADLLPFAVVIGYLFLKVAGRSRRAEAPTPPGRAADRPGSRPGAGAPTPFEQLLARLEEANGTGRPAPPSEPPPVRTPRPESPMFSDSRKAVAEYEARSAAASRFQTYDAGRGFDDETAGYAHERHGFGAQNPLSEPAFDAARGADRRPANPASQRYDPHGLRPAPPPAPGASIAERLASPAALRDAFVLQTILARRPALRTPRRPRRTG